MTKQNANLKRLNLLQCVEHGRLFSAKPGGYCHICGPESANPALMIDDTKQTVFTELKKDGTTQQVCRHGIPSGCKKCEHAAKERARRAAKKGAQ